jgi:hypothetical protein
MKYYEQLYVHNFNSQNEMAKLLARYKQPKFTQEEINI